MLLEVCYSLSQVSGGTPGHRALVLPVDGREMQFPAMVSAINN